MPAPKEVDSRTTEDAEERDEDVVAPGEIRFGEDSKFQQISINISFPFSSIVVPAGRRMSGGLFEFVRRAVPTRPSPNAPDEKEVKEAPHRAIKRPAA